MSSIDLTSFDTANVTTMAAMFNVCSGLKSLDVSNFDTGNVTTMNSMFYGCKNAALTKIVGVSQFDTGKVTNFGEMFRDCSSLTELNVGHFNLNTSIAVGMPRMFQGCSKLTSMDLRGWDTSRVANISYLFCNCTALTSVDTSSFDTSYMGSSGDGFYDMFFNCSSLPELDISNFVNPNNSKVNDMLKVVNGGSATSLKRLVLGTGFKFENGSPSLNPPPKTEGYTGKWIKAEEVGTFGPFDPAELIAAYNADPSAVAGVWVWETAPTTYTVKYDANGGAGSMPASFFEASEAAALPDSSFVRYGYSFAGWDLKPDGDGDGSAFADGNHRSLRARAYAAGDTVTLYAQWEPAEDRLSFEDGEATVKLRAGERMTLDGIPAGTTYRIWENTPKGWTLVQQSGTGGVIAPNETSAAGFTNEFTPAQTAVNLIATKTLDAQPVDEVGRFSFELADARGAVIDEQGNLAGGFVAFDAITYKEEGLRADAQAGLCEHAESGTGDAAVETWVYTYTIREKVGAESAIVYDQHDEYVQVVVTLDAAGDLSSAVVYDALGADGTEGAAFVNLTRPGELTLTKRTAVPQGLTGGDREFAFRVRFTNSLGQALDSISYTTAPASSAADAGASDGADAGSTGTQATGSRRASAVSSLPTVPAALNPFAPEQAYALPPALQTQAQFHATDEQLRGMAYVLISDDGKTATIFRSENAVPGANGSAESIDGVTYSGNISVINETGIPWSKTFWPWYSVQLEKVVFAGALKPKSVGNMFEGQKSLAEITGLELLDTSMAEDAVSMFKECEALESLDLRSFNTARMHDMNSMFEGCSSLASVDVSSFDTFEVERMERMFDGCSSLTTLDVSSFDVSKVDSMRQMFSDCEALEALDISSFDFSDRRSANVVDLYIMFNGCARLGKVVLGPGFIFYRDGVTWGAALLPDSPKPAFTGKWMLEDQPDVSMSAAELRDNYSADLAGVWVWEPNSTAYTVRFDANGGYTDAAALYLDSADPRSVGYAPPSARGGTADAEIIRPGYAFQGWNTKLDGTGDAYAADDPIGASRHLGSGGETITLYAQWDYEQSYPYTVQHYKQNADGTWPVEPTDVDTLQTNHEYIVPTPKDYAAEGFKAPESIEALQVTSDGNAVAKISYPRQTYTVHFDANGGTGAMRDQVPFVLVPTALSRNAFNAPVNSIFAGWNTESDGSGASYADAQRITDLAAADQTITLYAQWKTIESPAISTESGEVTVTLRADEQVTFHNLPNGTAYEITEVGLVDPADPDGPLLPLPDYGWKMDGDSGATYGLVGSIESLDSDQAQVTNVYEATGRVNLEAYKALAGATPEPGQFVFELYEADAWDEAAGAPVEGKTFVQRVVNGVVDGNDTIANPDGAGTIPNAHKGQARADFATISYDAAGTYTYYIRECVPEDAVNAAGAAYGTDGAAGPWIKDGVRYDGHVAKVAVVVVDNGDGTLKATPTYMRVGSAESDTDGSAPDGDGDDDPDPDANVFTNEMVPGSLEISKEVAGATDANAGAEFEFRVDLLDEADNTIAGTFEYTKTGDYEPYEKDGEGNDIVVSDRERRLVVRTIASGETLTLADGQTATIAGLPYKARYTVSEIARSGFTAESIGATGAIEADGTAQARFANTYAAEGSVRLEAQKVLSGAVLSAEQFTFELLNSEGEVLQTLTNAADGSVAFDEIDYTADDIGEHAYVIREVDSGEAGIAYDTVGWDVSVTVADNGDGTLSATPTYRRAGDGAQTDPAPDKALFNNAYDAVGEATIGVSKSVTGDRNWAADDEFTFELAPAGTDAAVAPMPKGTVGEGVNRTYTLTADFENQSPSFPTIEYHLSDLADGNGGYLTEREYTYTVREATESARGLRSDGTVYTIAVRLEHDREQAPGELSITRSVTASPARADSLDAEALPFANEYHAVGEAEIKVSKTLSGRRIANGEFQFKIAPVSNNADIVVNAMPLPASTTLTLAADGTDGIAQDAFRMSYRKAGTYVYQVTEIIPGAAVNSADVAYVDREQSDSGPWTLNGVTYDETVFEVVVRMVDNGDGTLSSEVTYGIEGDNDKGDDSDDSLDGTKVPAAAGFTNTYEASGSLEPQVRKTIENRDWNNAESYEFTLKPTGANAHAAPMPADSTGEGAQRVKSATARKADQTPSFGVIEFTLADLKQWGTGTGADGNGVTAGRRFDVFTYEVSEVERTGGGITTDSRVYTLTATVVDTTNGSLSVSWAYNANGSTDDVTTGSAGSVIMPFANVYTPAKTKATVQAVKHIEGRGWDTDETYQIKLVRTTRSGHTPPMPKATTEPASGAGSVVVDGDVAVATVSSTGTEDTQAEFADISFTYDDLDNGDGTYATSRNFYYMLEEVVPETAKNAAGQTYGTPGASGPWYKDGIQFDASVRSVMITLVDNGDGTLTATPYYAGQDAADGDHRADPPTFVNTYTAAPVSFSVSGTKSIGGTDFFGEYTFDIYDSVADEHREGLHYKVGNHGQGDLIRNSGTAMTASSPENTIDLSTVLEFTAPGTYDFILREHIPSTAVAYDKTTGKKVSPEKKYTDAERGTYFWKVDGLTYDRADKPVRVSVTDVDAQGNHTGVLTAQVTYSDGETATFSNTYAAEGTGSFPVTKTIAGRSGDWLDTDSYTIQLLDASGALVNDQQHVIGKDTTGHSATFQLPTYTLSDLTQTGSGTGAGGNGVAKGVKFQTFDYKLHEFADDGSGGDANAAGDGAYKDGKGVTYAADKTLTVRVSDHHTGTLTVECSTDNGATWDDVSAFATALENRYGTEDHATAELRVHKVYSGRTWGSETFTFKLLGESDAEVAEASITKDTPDHTATLKLPTYAQSDLDGETSKTFNYTLREVHPTDATKNTNDTWTKDGITYAADKNVCVTVTDKGNGTLGVTYSVDSGATSEDAPTITQANTYEITTPTQAQIKVSKMLSGRAWQEGDEFAFTLAAAEATYTDAAGGSGTSPLTAASGTGDIETTATIAYDAAGGSDTLSASFAAIKFTRPGVYYYTIAETIPEDAEGYHGASKVAGVTYGTTAAGARENYTWVYKGVTYASTMRGVRVTVEDNDTGGLKDPVVEYLGGADQNAPTPFVNTYTTTDVSIVLQGQKTMVGRNLIGGHYSFRLYEANADKTIKAVQSVGFPEVLSIEGADAASGTAVGTMVSRAFNYTKSDIGTYYYVVREFIPADAVAYSDSAKVEPEQTFGSDQLRTDRTSYTWVLDGVTYDASDSFITVNVTDCDAAGKRDGVLRATVVYDNATTGAVASDKEISDKAALTNSYKTGEATAQLQATKHISGRNWNHLDSYTFAVAVDDAQSDTGFEKPAGASLPSNASASPAAKKSVSATIDAVDKTVSFNTVTFDRSWLKKKDGNYATSRTFAYTISENDLAESLVDKGITKDATTHRAFITLTDREDGTLAATVRYGDELSEAVVVPPVFTNNYSASGPATVSATKQLSGQVLQADQFEFGLYGQDGTLVGAAVKNKADGSITFSLPTYTLDDLDGYDAHGNRIGTKTYTIRELVPKEAKNADGQTYGTPGAVDPWSKDGVTYDESAHAVSVSLMDQGDGTISTTVSYDSGATIPQLSNVYEASGQASLDVRKTLEGRPITSSERFVFKVTDITGLGEDKIADAVAASTTTFSTDAVTQSGQSVATAAYPFRFTQADLANDAGQALESKTFTYRITEVAGSNQAIAYDTTAYDVDVMVRDRRDGTLDVQVVRKDAQLGALVFSNTYSAAGTWQPKVTKTLTGRAWGSDEYTFTLSGDSLADPQQVSVSEQGAEATFAGVSFNLENLNQVNANNRRYGVFEYTIAEDGSLPDGVMDTTGPITATVTVTDNGEGSLVVNAEYTDSAGRSVSLTPEDEASDTGGALPFANSYEAEPTQATLYAAKHLDGRSWDSGETFTFKLATTDGSPLPAAEGGSTAVAEAEGVPVAFGPIAYTFADMGGQTAKRFHYTITEQGTNGAGLVYDHTPIAVTVTVKDDGSGNLRVSSIEYADGKKGTGTPAGASEAVDTALATNTYTAQGAELALGGTKTYNMPIPNGVFSFQLFETGADYAVAAAGDPVRTAVVGAGESPADFSFEKLAYDEPGTHYYVIREVRPAGATEANGYTADGIAYDVHDAHVVVEVTDVDAQGKHTGQLVATAAYATGGNAPAFANTYDASGVTHMSLTKRLSGRAWRTEEADGHPADSFTFSLSAQDSSAVAAADTPMPGNTKGGSVALTAAAPDTAVSTADITYTLADLAQTAAADTTDLLPSSTLVKAGTRYNVFAYELRETSEADDGVTPDAQVYTIEVTVVDNGDGTLRAEQAVTDKNGAAVAAENLPFTNVYRASDITADVRAGKHIEGRAWQEDESYTFVLARSDAASPLPKASSDVTVDEGAGTATVFASSAAGSESDAPVVFPSIEFTFDHLRNADGTTYALERDFYYTLAEQLPVDDKGTPGTADDEVLDKKDGIEYDASVKTVRIHLVDNGDGTLTATTYYDATADATEEPVFVNTYAPEPIGFAIDVFKLINGALVTPDMGSYSFGLYDDNADVDATGASAGIDDGVATDVGKTPYKWGDLIGSAELSSANQSHAHVPVGTVSFTMPGEYHYLIREMIPEGAKSTVDGLTYHVEDGADYEATSLEVRDAHTWVKDGVTYYSAPIPVTVTVTDPEGNGGLVAAVAYDQDNSAYAAVDDELVDEADIEASAVLSNTYSVEDGTAQVRARKEIAGRAARAGDAFTFVLTPMNSAPFRTAANREGLTQLTGTATPGAGALVEFEPLVFTREDLGDADSRIFTYRVHEQVPVGAKAVNGSGQYVDDAGAVVGSAEDALTYTSATTDEVRADHTWKYQGFTYASDQTVSITVTDDKAGSLVTTFGEHAVHTMEALVFENDYTTSDTSVRIQARKRIVDIDGNPVTGWIKYKADGTTVEHDWSTRTFKAELRSTRDDTPMPEGAISRDDHAGGKVKTVEISQPEANGSYGIADFGEIVFSGPGEWTYAIVETLGDGMTAAHPVDGENHLTYDVSVRSVTIVVSDNGDGTLAEPVVTYGGVQPDSDGYPVLTNHETGDDEIVLKTRKSLAGETMTSAQFRFELFETDADFAIAPDAKPIATAANDADGWVAGVAREYTVADITDHPAGSNEHTATFYYVGREIIPDGAQSADGRYTYTAGRTTKAVRDANTWVKDGVTYSTNESRFVVTITEKIESTSDFAQNHVYVSRVRVGDSAYAGSAGDGVSGYDAQGMKTVYDYAFSSEHSVADAQAALDEWYASFNAWPQHENSYEATGTARVPVMKRISGRDWLASDAFTFELTPVDGAPLRTSASGAAKEQLSVTVRSATAVPFADIVFTQDDLTDGSGGYVDSKTFRYTIHEVAPSGATVGADGTWTKDGISSPADKTVDITVTNNRATGTLDVTYGATHTTTQDPVEFLNTYSITGETAAELLGAKQISGRNWQSGDSFELVLAPGANTAAGSVETPMPENTTGTGDARVKKVAVEYASADAAWVNAPANTKLASFGTITFDKPGVYNYTITETVPGESEGITGITYSTVEHTATVTVVDNGQGGLTASVSYGTASHPAPFVNTYKPLPTKIKLKAQKTLRGRDIQGGEFSFELYEADENYTKVDPQPEGFPHTLTVESAAQSGGAAVDPNMITSDIHYDETGEYHYVMVEKVPAGADRNGRLNGVTYDRSESQVKVEVTDIDPDSGSDDQTGQLYATATYANAAPDADVTASTAHTNMYKASDAGAQILVGKQIVGRGWNGNDSYTFKLESVPDESGTFATAAAPMPKNAVKSPVVGASTPGHQVAFANMVFTHDLLELADSSGVGTGNYETSRVFTYRISENDHEVPSVDRDTSSYIAKVTLMDDGMGGLSTTVAYYEADGTTPISDSPIPVFTNTYTAAGWARVEATKVLENGTLAAGDFAFELLDATEAVVGTATNDADGSVVFSGEGSDGLPALKYTLDDLTDGAATRTYTLREVEPTDAPAYMGYDTDERVITVSLLDNGDGTISAEPEFTTGLATFKNTYTASGNAVVPVRKVLEGRAISELFTVEVRDATGLTDAQAAAGPVIESIQVGRSAANGQTEDTRSLGFAFDQSQIGTHEYLVSERNDGAGGMSYDGASYRLRAVVTDPDRNGELSVAMSRVDGEPLDAGHPLVFTNTYTARGSWQPAVAKTLAGRPWLPGDEFSFALYEGAGAEGEPVSTAIVTGAAAIGSGANVAADMAGGSAPVADVPVRGAFDAQTFVLDDLDGWTDDHRRTGTFAYSVRETSLDGDGISVDPVVYDIVLTVTDNGDGTLAFDEAVTDAEGSTVADATAAGDGLPFANTYTAEPATVVLGVAKELAGRDWIAGEGFSFELSDIGPAPLPAEGGRTVSVSADAPRAEFGAITFTRDDMAGAMEAVFTYRIHEDRGGTTVAGLSYDADKLVRIAVTDDGAGTLTAGAPEYSADGGATWAAVDADTGVVFANSYTPESARVVLQGLKTFKNGTVGKRQFGFRLYGAGEDFAVPADADALQTAYASEGAGAGSFAFEAIGFDEPGTYRYVVREVVPAGAAEGAAVDGVVYDTHDARVTVTVVRNADGTLSAVAAYDNAGARSESAQMADRASFTNEYRPQGPKPPSAKPAAALTKTGDSLSLLALGVLAFVSLVAMTAALVRRRRG